MASELSKFIEDELLREGNTGERSRLVNGGAFSVVLRFCSLPQQGPWAGDVLQQLMMIKSGRV